MPLKPLMVTRRNTNLKDALISSKLKDSKHPAVSGKEIQNYWEPCHIEKCNICNSIYKGTISNKHSKTETKTLRNVDCNTTNVIYSLECSIRKTRYIGETKRAFKLRLKEHLADIKYNRERETSVNTHQQTRKTERNNHPVHYWNHQFESRLAKHHRIPKETRIILDLSKNTHPVWTKYLQLNMEYSVP